MTGKDMTLEEIKKVQAILLAKREFIESEIAVWDQFEQIAISQEFIKRSKREIRLTYAQYDSRKETF